MPIDPTFTANTESRLIKIEDALTRIWKLLSNAINKEQFNRLNAIRQKDLSLIYTRLTALEARVTTLENNYNNLL